MRIVTNASSRILLAGLVALLPMTMTAGGVLAKGGSHGASSCARNAPGIVIDNNWAWGTPGSWGLPGQRLAYAIDVINYDVGCGSSTFVLSMTAPDGFTVSIPTNLISLKSSGSEYLWAYVTSPTVIADGDYALTASVARGGTTSPTATAGNYYKVYSSDTTAPTMFWPNPADGQTITARSYTIVVSSSDDHAVRALDLYLDNVFVASAACDDVSYTCQLSYSWSTVKGTHTATFASRDWIGNSSSLTVTFTVG